MMEMKLQNATTALHFLIEYRQTLHTVIIFIFGPLRAITVFNMKNVRLDDIHNDSE